MYEHLTLLSYVESQKSRDTKLNEFEKETDKTLSILRIENKQHPNSEWAVNRVWHSLFKKKPTKKAG